MPLAVNGEANVLIGLSDPRVGALVCAAIQTQVARLDVLSAGNHSC